MINQPGLKYLFAPFVKQNQNQPNACNTVFLLSFFVLTKGISRQSMMHNHSNTTGFFFEPYSPLSIYPSVCRGYLFLKREVLLEAETIAVTERQPTMFCECIVEKDNTLIAGNCANTGGFVAVTKRRPQHLLFNNSFSKTKPTIVFMSSIRPGKMTMIFARNICIC